MIKRSSSRNHRSKGIKVKHVLQIILLVGICFWLVYQVKRSHDKKKEFDESDAKMSVRTQTAYQIPKLGRKDLHPGKDEVNQNEKNVEEEEDENIVEDEDKHEPNEHGKEGNGHETEQKDDKHGERGGEEQEEDERVEGDDEIDENDQEKSDVDADRDEEFVDEEKEKEEEGDEKENENNEDEEKEKEGLVENHNSHEAREENYKGDDASSAVTHDTQTTSTETEMVSLENSGVNSEMGITKLENKPNHTEDSIRNQPSSDFNITEVQLTGGTSSNATYGNETGNNSLSNSVNSSHLNNIASTFSNSHAETSSNLTVVIPGASNNGTGAHTSPQQNKTVKSSKQAQNNTMNSTVTGDVKNVQAERLEQGDNRVSEENLPGSNLTVLAKTENGAAAGGEFSNLEVGDIEKTRRFVVSNETENKGNTEMGETNKTQNNLYMKENTDANKDEEFKGDTLTSETADSSSANGTSASVQHHATGSYDSHILKGVTEVQTDLDTLPDIRNEGDNGEATTTE